MRQRQEVGDPAAAGALAGQLGHPLDRRRAHQPPATGRRRRPSPSAARSSRRRPRRRRRGSPAAPEVASISTSEPSLPGRAPDRRPSPRSRSRCGPRRSRRRPGSATGSGASPGGGLDHDRFAPGTARRACTRRTSRRTPRRPGAAPARGPGSRRRRPRTRWCRRCRARPRSRRDSEAARAGPARTRPTSCLTGRCRCEVPISAAPVAGQVLELRRAHARGARAEAAVGGLELRGDLQDGRGLGHTSIFEGSGWLAPAAGPGDRVRRYSWNSVSIQSICGAQLAAHDLDLVAGLLLAHALEVLLAGAVLGDPLAGEVARTGSRPGSASSPPGTSSPITRLPRVMSPYSAVLEIE